MTQAGQVLHHAVTKVRRLAEPPADVDRGLAWVAMRPFPPGMQPTFLGSIWFWHGGGPDARTPALHLFPLQKAGALPAFWFVNVFFDPFLGGWALLDHAPGWRRIDFTFALPSAGGGARVRALVERPGGGSPLAIEAGTLAQAHGVWQFEPAATDLLPFAQPFVPALRAGFIGGAPKSGVTWMQILLNQHEQVLANGEGDLLNHVQVRPFQSNNLWIAPEMPRPALGDLANHAFLHAILQLYRVHTGCAWVIDKSPGYAQDYRRLLAFTPEAKLIHCVRHPLDVLASRLHHEASIVQAGAPSREMATLADALGRLPAMLAGSRPLVLDAPGWTVVERVLDEYAQVQHEALDTLRERPGRLLIVRYEDMLADTAACAARVFAHLGVKTTPELAADCARNASFGNLRDRRENRAHSFFRAGTSGQYVQMFAGPDQARAMAHLQARLPGLAELGYALAPG